MLGGESLQVLLLVKLEDLRSGERLPFRPTGCFILQHQAAAQLVMPAALARPSGIWLTLDLLLYTSVALEYNLSSCKLVELITLTSNWKSRGRAISTSSLHESSVAAFEVDVCCLEALGGAPGWDTFLFQR